MLLAGADPVLVLVLVVVVLVVVVLVVLHGSGRVLLLGVPCGGRRCEGMGMGCSRVRIRAVWASMQALRTCARVSSSRAWAPLTGPYPRSSLGVVG